jgi:hypothetical protein
VLTSCWDVLAKQVAAGINFGLSGRPYWTTDIGGFFVNEFKALPRCSEVKAAAQKLIAGRLSRRETVAKRSVRRLQRSRGARAAARCAVS